MIDRKLVCILECYASLQSITHCGGRWNKVGLHRVVSKAFKKTVVDSEKCVPLARTKGHTRSYGRTRTRSADGFGDLFGARSLPASTVKHTVHAEPVPRWVPRQVRQTGFEKKEIETKGFETKSPPNDCGFTLFPFLACSW